MNEFTQKLIIALVIVPIPIGIFRGPTEMAIVAGAISVGLFFANLDKFKSFKGGGIEAQLRTAVNDAYAAIHQLRELGVSVSSPIVDALAISGRMMQFIPLKYKLERVEKIAETLKKLGVSDKEIQEVCSTMYERVTDDHIRGVLSALKSSNPGKEKLLEGLGDGKFDGWDKAKFETFIKDNELKKNENAEEWLEDLEYFLKTKKLRREDNWQS